MKTVRDLLATLEDTVSTNLGSAPVVVGDPLQRRPIDVGRKLVRRRKRKRDAACMRDVTEAFVTRPLHGDPNKWEVKVGKKRLIGVWRTMRSGKRVFFADDGTTIPAKPFGEDTDMSELLQQLMEASGQATKQVVQIIAEEMAAAPKVLRRLGKVLDGEVDQAALATVLQPVIAKFLEKHGVKVAGASQAQKALRTMAKE